MATFLPVKYGCNSIPGSKDISIYVSFGHFLFWSEKCTTVRKKAGHIKFCFPINKLSKNIWHLLLTKTSHGFTIAGWPLVLESPGNQLSPGKTVLENWKTEEKSWNLFFQSIIVFWYLTSVLLNRKSVRLFTFLANPFFERYISMNLVVLQVVL